MLLNKEIKSMVNTFMEMALDKEESFKCANEFYNQYEESKNSLYNLMGGKFTIEKRIKAEKSKYAVIEDIHKSNIIHDIYVESTKYFKYGVIEESSSYWTLADFLSNVNLSAKYTSQDIHLMTIDKKEICVKAGTKVSKVIAKLVNKDDTILTKYSKIMNNRYITGTLCVSIHPMDFLTSSINNYKWTSCFNMFKNTTYRIGSLYTLMGSQTLVAYVKGDHDMNLGHELYWNDKKWRTFVLLSNDNKTIYINRHYPFTSESLNREIVQLISTITNQEYKVREEDNEYLTVISNDYCYNDSEDYNYFSFHTDQKESKKSTVLELGSMEIVCPTCGQSLLDEDEIQCEYC